MASRAFKHVRSDILKKMTLDEVLSHVKKAVQFLKETEDYSTKDVGNAIKFMSSARNIDQIKVTNKATDHGLAQQFVKIVRSLESFFTSSDKGEQGADNLARFLLEFANSTDDCPALGIDFAKHGGVDCTITLLKNLNEQKMDVWLIKRIEQLLSCLLNSIRHDGCSGNRSIYRKAGVVQFMKKLLGTSHKTKALLILSYIVDDEESEILGKDNTTVVYLVGLFKEAAASKDHTATVNYEDGAATVYELIEIANSLSNLIINDTNKKVVFHSGGIPVMNSMLTAEFSAEEQTLAAKLLWSLSFDEEVQKSDAIKGSLKALLTCLTSANEKSVRSACKNAVWQISCQPSIEKSEEEKKSAQAAPSKDSGLIMISYNWTHQHLALQIRDELEAAGYNIWIDVDKMEATYAYKKKKPVIPLMLEEDYDPEGWLDILIGTKLYYKLFSDKEVQNNMDELKKAIGRQCQQLAVHADSTDGAVKPKKSETTASARPSTSEACSWSNERVLKWFDEIKLPQLKEVLDFCDGSDLKDIYEKSSRDSELFEKDFKSDFGLKYKDVLRLKSALKKLF